MFKFFLIFKVAQKQKIYILFILHTSWLPQRKNELSQNKSVKINNKINKKAAYFDG